VLTVCALALWGHVVLLLFFAIWSRSLRLLVVNRLMMRLATGYGTAPHQLIGIWLFLLFMPLAIILGHRDLGHQADQLGYDNLTYVEKAGALTGPIVDLGRSKPAPTTSDLTQAPPPDPWWLAFEATVPIIQLKAAEDWQASEQPRTVVGRMNGADIVIPFDRSPKQVENSLRVIGWVFWPLAVAGLAASFVHRRRLSGAS